MGKKGARKVQAVCLAIVFGTSTMGNVGAGQWADCLLPVNPLTPELFFFNFSKHCI